MILRGKDLLKRFASMPVEVQNKIMVEAFGQIDRLRREGLAYAPFTWRDCELRDGALVIDAPTRQAAGGVEYEERNLKDYAGIIYCLATGKNIPESMGWDADKKVKSAVLREIVLTLCGRNNSVVPLLRKLREPYVDEDTFFDNYETVDEKDAREAYEHARSYERARMEDKAMYDMYKRERKAARASAAKSWGRNIGIFFLMALCFGGYRYCTSQVGTTHYGGATYGGATGGVSHSGYPTRIPSAVSYPIMMRRVKTDAVRCSLSTPGINLHLHEIPKIDFERLWHMADSTVGQPRVACGEDGIRADGLTAEGDSLVREAQLTDTVVGVSP